MYNTCVSTFWKPNQSTSCALSASRQTVVWWERCCSTSNKQQRKPHVWFHAIERQAMLRSRLIVSHNARPLGRQTSCKCPPCSSSFIFKAFSFRTCDDLKESKFTASKPISTLQSCKYVFGLLFSHVLSLTFSPLSTASLQQSELWSQKTAGFKKLSR